MSRKTQARRNPESGHLMAGLMAFVAILMIVSMIGFQEWIDVLRRDNEAEMIFRAKDYVRAIQRYRKEHGGQGPLKLELLMEPGQSGQYYLRRLWTDPLMEDGKWGLLYMGPGGNVIDPNADPAAGVLSSGRSDLSSSSPDPQQQARQQAEEQRQEAIRRLADSAPTGTGDSEVAGGQLLVGLPIAGVRSLSTDAPFRYYNGLTEYNQWKFTYLDLERAVPGGAGGPGAGQGGQPGQPGAGGRQPGRQGRRPPAGPGTGGLTPNTPPAQGQQPGQPSGGLRGGRRR